ncbi:MAG: hypothetical protein KGY54_13885 [Oleiphilaceae bacterium]|nr:hypothetical protein [Oleiphilaceae bacterium]
MNKLTLSALALIMTLGLAGCSDWEEEEQPAAADQTQAPATAEDNAPGGNEEGGGLEEPAEGGDSTY